MRISVLDNLLWALSLLANCALLIVLVVKRRVETFPVFTTLIVSNICRSAILFFTVRFGSVQLYFYVYWVLALFDFMLQLALVYELASKLFRPLGFWAADVRRVVVLLSVPLVGIPIGLTLIAAPTAHLLKLTLIIRGDFLSSCLISELFVLMVVLSGRFGFHWPTHSAFIAFGYGFYALYGVLVDVVHSYFGATTSPEMHKVISRTQILLYISCLVFWAVTLARRVGERSKVPERIHADLLALNLQLISRLNRFRVGGPTR